MTEVAQIYLGNINHNSDLFELVQKETCLEVFLTVSDRQKGRIHTHTDTGVAIGIIKSRDRALQSGDLFQTESGDLIRVHLQERELMVLSFSESVAVNVPVKLVHLGHILGNQHYPIVVQDNKIYVQLVTDAKIIEKTIKDLHIAGLEINYEMRSPNKHLDFSAHSH
ncbi:urease accessory protein UreE [Pleurocapsa sp. PCC 7319]|uniref:urease accessory protein UreE n=1 Tax=Pleurocapsa sp. PCC 7319 TaxID=118161 RepID=UPI00034CF878|nr:hypothetical protein [Pleurocapsa sp. PCC 7319]